MSGLAQGVLNPVSAADTTYQFRGMSQRMSRLGGGGRNGGARTGKQVIAPGIHYTFRDKATRQEIAFTLNTAKHRTSITLPEGEDTMEVLRTFLNNIASPGIGAGRSILEGYDRWAVMSFKMQDGKDGSPDTLNFEVQFFHPEDDDNEIPADDDEDEDTESESEEDESEESEQGQLDLAVPGANRRGRRNS